MPKCPNEVLYLTYKISQTIRRTSRKIRTLRALIKQLQAINELSEKNGVSKGILQDTANNGRFYREIFVRADPGDLAFLISHRSWLVLSH